jgi:hypothetical protein
MIRALVIVAIGGFFLSVACFSAAIAIGGPDIATAIAWNDGWPHGERHFGHWRRMREASGPAVTRELAWSGGDTLSLDTPALVEYVQSSGPARLTVTGPAAVLDSLSVDDGEISLDGARFRSDGLRIVLSAPSVHRFQLHAAGKIDIRNYRQSALEVEISGAGQVTAAGQADAVDIDVSGMGDADLGALKTRRARIDVSGAGAAKAAPTDWARVEISGVGGVHLLTRPKRLETAITGVGTLHQPGDNPAASAADPVPTGPKRAA